MAWAGHKSFYTSLSITKVDEVVGMHSLALWHKKTPPHSKMIRLIHYPTYLIKIYCTELNRLHLIQENSHRGHRILFKVASVGKISVCAASVHVCLSSCVCMHNEQLHDMILSLLSLGALTVTTVDSIPPLLPATFEFNHCGSAVVQITLGSSTPSHYTDCNWILEKPRGRAWLK